MLEVVVLVLVVDIVVVVFVEEVVGMGVELDVLDVTVELIEVATVEVEGMHYLKAQPINI